MSTDYESIHVHLDNPQDIQVQRTEEKEPEHFIFATFILQLGQAANAQFSGIQPYEKILALDPDRKDASINTVDQAVIICHSAAQAQFQSSPAGNVNTPAGVYLPAGSSMSISGTGAVWAAAVTAAGPTRVGVAINRRGE